MTSTSLTVLADDELARARAAEKQAAALVASLAAKKARADRSMADAEALRRDLSFAAHAGGDLIARDKLASAARVLIDAQLQWPQKQPPL